MEFGRSENKNLLILRSLGDEMNVWSNFGELSAAEHSEVLSVEANFTSGQHSRPIIAMKQDAMTGGYLLTFGDVVIDKATFFDCIALEHFDFDIMEKYDHILEVYRWKGIYKQEEDKLEAELEALTQKKKNTARRFLLPNPVSAP